MYLKSSLKLNLHVDRGLFLFHSFLIESEKIWNFHRISGPNLEIKYMFLTLGRICEKNEKSGEQGKPKKRIIFSWWLLHLNYDLIDSWAMILMDWCVGEWEFKKLVPNKNMISDQFV